MSWTIPFDTTKFVSSAVHDVYKTLIEAAVLVLVVILVFLQDWRATLVPATTVPVTIIGAFAAMAVLGFTVNLSTLFAIILAIGIVVDDAIIVVEGAAKHIEHGLTPHDAAIKAMDELLGPILGITLVLMAVFIPAAFLPGLSGQMYRQFALVIAATAMISAVNAMTLKPTQCALWLRPVTPPEQRNFLYRGFNRVYNALEHAYARLIARMVGHSGTHGADRCRPRRPRRVQPEPRADRLPAHRGPGLLPRHRAAARGRRAGAHHARARRHHHARQGSAGRREGRRHRRPRRTQRQRQPFQRRRRLRHPQGLGRARQRRGSARPLQRASTRASKTFPTAPRWSSRRRPSRASATSPAPP